MTLVTVVTQWPLRIQVALLDEQLQQVMRDSNTPVTVGLLTITEIERRDDCVALWIDHGSSGRDGLLHGPPDAPWVRHRMFLTWPVGDGWLFVVED